MRYPLGALVMGAYIALTAFMLVRYFATAFRGGDFAAAPSRAPWRTVLTHVFAAYALSRAVMLAALAVCYLGRNGYVYDFFDALGWMLDRWDAGQYLPLIEHGYAAQGDEALRIVFFPLYPMLCRGIGRLTGLSANACALCVSNLCLPACGVLLWRLAEADESAEGAVRCVWLFMFFPVTFFFSMAYSESLFLMLSLAAVLCARRRRFIAAVVFGALCANTRMLGMAIAVPIYWEMLCADDRPPLHRALLCAPRVLPVAAGLGAYLLLNQRLFGDPFRFMTYERENWQQRFGTLMNTFQYTFNNALTYGRHDYRFATWWPQLAALLGVPALVFAQRRKSRAGDLAHALVYHYAAFAPTWLLSGVRYAAGGYALYLMLGSLAHRRFAVALAVEAALMVYMTVWGLWIGVVL